MDDKQRADLAKRIIDNPIWQEVWEEFEWDMFQEFRLHADLATRERVSMAMDMIDDIKSKVEAKMTYNVPLKIVGDNNGS